MSEWIKATDCMPDGIGVFEWRMPSAVVEGMALVVAACMRRRGAGYKDVISPSFDYWDGYQVILPKGLEWRIPDVEHDIKEYSIKLIDVEGVKNEPCPFCGNVPVLHAAQRPYGGGIVVGASPQNYNAFWLKCCGWVASPEFKSPFELAEVRNQKILSAMTAIHSE